MRIFIEPVEPLLLRTGRPFIAGEDSFAESIFPPTPETFQGALRAALAVQWGHAQRPPITDPGTIFTQPALVELLGDGNHYARFRISGITLGKYNPETKHHERLYPAPAHIIEIQEEGSREKKLIRHIPRHDKKQKKGSITNQPDGYEMLSPEEQFSSLEVKPKDMTGWLTAKGLQAVLNDDHLQYNSEHTHQDKVFEYESRLGIGMNNNTRTSEYGMLYQVQVIRMKEDYGFIIDLEFGEQQYKDAAIPPMQKKRDQTPPGQSFIARDGWITIGGERRTARLLDISNQLTDEYAGEESGNMLYFVTPAYFKRGWQPADPGILPGKPIAAAINRYQSIGGWSLDPHSAGGQAKCTRRCIPAGSIFFFDQNISIKRPMTEYGWQIGYGIAYSGRWK